MNPFNYLHLANPLYTLVHTGEDVKDTPAGLELAKNPRLNLALWNAIGVAGTVAPLAFLINTIVNRKHDSEVESKLNKSLVRKVEALRPRLVADPNLMDISSYTDRPKSELEELEKLKETLSKNASEERPGLFSWLGDKVLSMAAEGIYAGLPLAALPLAAVSGIGLATSIDRKRIKDRLKERRMQLRNIQAYVDRLQLEDAGLVKAEKRSDSIKELNNKMSKEASIDKESAEVSIPQIMLSDVPMMALTGGSLLLGGSIFNILKDKDENVAILKYLKDRQLGSNITQGTPQIGIVDLPVDPRNILATPGDKNEELAYEDPAEIIEEYKESKKAGKGKGKGRESTESKNTKSKNSKKDAIF